MLPGGRSFDLPVLEAGDFVESSRKSRLASRGASRVLPECEANQDCGHQSQHRPKQREMRPLVRDRKTFQVARFRPAESDRKQQKRNGKGCSDSPERNATTPQYEYSRQKKSHTRD